MAAGVVFMNEITSATSTNVVDWSDHRVSPHLSFKLLIEAEDCSLAGWMDIASATAASLEGLGCVLVEGVGRGSRSLSRRPRSYLRSVAKMNGVSSATAASVERGV